MKHFYNKKRSININIENLYLNHIDVIKRYDFGDEELHQMIDRFLPQIIEESYEFNIEMYNLLKTDNIKERYELTSLASLELLDIILYFVSINSTLIEKYNLEYKYVIELNDLNFSKDFVLNTGEKVSDDKFYQTIIDSVSKTVVNNGGHIRRLTPNRKYHQENKKVSKKEMNHIIGSIFFINHKTIDFLLTMLFEKLSLEKDVDLVLDKIQEVVKNK
ncbi:hypothetical protein CPT_Machias_093 [Staphylococcus phage Machias]|nr:hypothetical protein CPT_Machias_093 [Staphylococcus phage Machias]WPH64083.1 hypothetical protein [Staphylococcus phage vB_StaM_PB50]